VDESHDRRRGLVGSVDDQIRETRDRPKPVSSVGKTQVATAKCWMMTNPPRGSVDHTLQPLGSRGVLHFVQYLGEFLPRRAVMASAAGPWAPYGQRRPIAAFGNSDGDLQMLQWTTGGTGARLALLVRHTDAIREWEYDRQADVGCLDHALDEANAKGWTVVDMKHDWRRVFPFEWRREHPFCETRWCRQVASRTVGQQHARRSALPTEQEDVAMTLPLSSRKLRHCP
jgi:hypothetical protein